jgi:hypothetical protein
MKGQWNDNEPAYAMRAGFRWVAYTKPANDVQDSNIKQVKPALRLPAQRYAQGDYTVILD